MNAPAKQMAMAPCSMCAQPAPVVRRETIPGAFVDEVKCDCPRDPTERILVELRGMRAELRQVVAELRASPGRRR